MQTTAPQIAPQIAPGIANVGELASRAARIHAKRLAVTSAQRSVTYEELEQRSNRLANALCGLGLQRGDRVGVYLPNCIEIVELELACYKAALVKAPINARLAPVEVAEVIANSEATLIVTTTERAEGFLPLLKGAAPRLLLLDAADGSPASYEGMLSRASDRFTPARVRADELAVLHYTSGSSGVLKAAMQTFGNRLAQLRKFLMRADNLQPGDLLGLVGPITHASGMQLVPALCSGATIRLFGGFDPGRFIAEMKRERVTHTFMVPTMINMLLAEVQGRYRPLPDLRRLGYGAAPMAPARIMQAMDVFGPVLSQGYGAGETTSGVCGLSVEDHLFARAAMPGRLASCGRPFLESQVDIVDDEGQPVATGEIGEIVVGGADIFAGYWRAPELTAEVLKNGRYHTGDLARADDEGYIYIVDRKKDMVISGGFNVYPSEVEAVLYQHAAVDEACVFSVPDDKWGEAVAAHIVLKPGVAADAATLDAFCAERLAGFKRPRRIEFVEALQKNANGKIARKLIQSPYWAGHDRPRELRSRTAMNTQVISSEPAATATATTAVTTTATAASSVRSPLFDGPFEGSERAAELIARIGDFLHGELATLVREEGIDHEHGADRATLRRVWRRSHELGFYGMTLPTQMGGLGLSLLDHVLIKESIYASGSPLAPHVFGELSGPPRVGALARYATPMQLANFIVPVAQAEKAICFALTETEAGSDPGALQTQARLEGDTYVINGRKRFISGSPFADFAVLMASTSDSPERREISAFFVDLRQSGVEVKAGYKTMAGQSTTGDILLTDCRVPAANLIGEPGRGLALALGRITVNRLLHCPGMVGLATVALKDARDYARTRRQFGQPIAQFQAIQHSLADMATQLAAARALMLSTARQLDAGGDARADASMAKLFCSEAAFRIADAAVQIHGGEGIVQGRRVEFLFRMLRMYRVLTGTSEIQKNIIARELLGEAP